MKEKIPSFQWSIEKWIVDGHTIDVVLFQTMDGTEFRCTVNELDRIVEQCFDENEEEQTFLFVPGSLEEN